MNKIIFQNRILVWAVFIATFVAIFSWWAATLFSIEEADQALYLNASRMRPQFIRSENISSWKIYSDSKTGFEFRIPPDGVADSQDASRINLAISPGTTLLEKYILVHTGDNIESCEKNIGGAVQKKEPIDVNNMQFTKYTASGVATGNIYETTAYAVIKDGKCIMLSFVFHSANPGVFDSPPPLFDREKEYNVVEQILNTFGFTVDTSNWKTYRSATYGVTFKYPPQDIQEGGGDYQKYFFVRFQNPTMQDTTCKDIALNQISSINNYGLMQSRERALLQDPNLTGDASYYTADNIRYYIDGSYIKQKPEPIKEKIVNGVHVLRIPFLFRCHENEYSATVIDGKSMVRGVLWYGSSVYNFEGDQESFDKILSTLNFFEPSKTIDILNWKTYHNNKYGFKFRYPEDYKMAENITDQGSYITVGAVSVGVSSRQDAMLADQHSREFTSKCLQDPSQYEGEEGFSGCGDVNSTATVKEWDSEKAFLENAKVGDMCQNSSVLACTVGIFQGKALEQYNSLCYGGCGAWKIYVFYHGPFRYVIHLGFKDDRLSLEQMKKLEEDDPYVRMLNAVVGTLTFFNPGQ